MGSVSEPALSWQESLDAEGVWWAWPDDQTTWCDDGDLALRVWQDEVDWYWEVLDGDAGDIGLSSQRSTKEEAMMAAEAAATQTVTPR
jgi:hypothetical protein